jgi:lipid A 3-O-deacylase
MKIVFFAIACLATATPAFSENRGSYTFQLDNDLFANTDKDYTNGARLSYITSDRETSDFTDMESWLASVQRQTPDIITGFSSPEDPVYNYGVSLTQLMFTPDDLNAFAAPPGEHPYVGWLALGFSLHAKDSNAINSVELSLGLTGKNAFAETTQDFVHSVRDIPKFNGWDSQMPSELTVNLFFTQKRRLFRDAPTDTFFSSDGFGEWGLALGNYKTAIDFGFITRAGFNLPADISDPRLGPTSYSHNIFDGKLERTSNWSAFVIFGAKAGASLHDISLDGPLLRNFEMGIEKRPISGEAYLGVALRWQSWELSYVHTFRSREFEEQPNGPQFGSLSLRLRL